jgi:hypothetical protein
VATTSFAQGIPDLSKFDSRTRELIENACTTERYTGGPANYAACLNRQIASSRGTAIPDLSKLDSTTRELIENACTTQRYTGGPASYAACLNRHIASSAGTAIPDLSKLDPTTRELIENACTTQKYTGGPASYAACLKAHLATVATSAKERPAGVSTPPATAAKVPPAADRKPNVGGPSPTAPTIQAPKDISVSVPQAASRTIKSIPMEKDGGTYVVGVVINGAIALKFVVDSGAADVSIPADVVMTLMRTGTLTENDFLGTKTYVLADGSKVPSRTFRIRSLKVGDMVVENVTGSMAGAEGALLLGQSFLGRFNSWSIDNNKHILILE